MTRRILWVGDAAATGFGTVTSGLAGALLKAGADVRFISQNMTGEPLGEPFGSRTWDARVLHPATVIARGFADGWKPQAAVVLGDYAAARYVILQQSDEIRRLFASIPAYHYVPIEGHDLPPAWRDLWTVLRPVAMSKFGQAEIAKVIGYEPPLVYHGVETDDFYPITPSRPGRLGQVKRNGQVVQDYVVTSKEACKAFFGIPPDWTVALRTDRYMPRKGYNHLLRAMLPVMERVEKLGLIIHCRPFDQGGSLYDELSKYPDWFIERIHLTQAHDTYQGLPRPVLNALYNAADIYVSVSAEGFGLTIAEAIAAGVPAVGVDYSAVPEVIGPAGQVVPVGQLVYNEYNHFWALPDGDAFGKAVEYLATHPSKRRALGAAGPAHVARNFDWAEAARRFLALMDSAVVDEVAA